MAETEPRLPKHDGSVGPKSTKHFTSFLYKASLALIFLVIIPLFPSQAPEFINQTVPSRSWELLHLVFVGIAVSYGIFSRRNNEDIDKEPPLQPLSKFDSAQSYVSGLLQVSSVFDEETEAQPGSPDEAGKLETWSNQYYPNEPVVVVAKEQEPNVVVGKQRVDSTEDGPRVGEKRLLLPIRSLKSRVPDDNDEKATIDETRGVSGNHSISRSSSKSSSKRFPGSSSQMQKLGGSEQTVDEEETTVLPSPIPWRSRSGKMELEEEALVSPFGSMENFEYFRAKPEASKPQLSLSSRSSSSSKASLLSRKSSFSSESQAKIAEDFVRTKSFKKPSPPPPPPPPPVVCKSSSMKPSLGSSYHRDGVSLNKELRRSHSSNPKEADQGYYGTDTKPRSTALYHDVGKSVRTLRAQKSKGYGADDASMDNSDTRKRIGTIPKLSSLSEEEKDGVMEDVVSDSDDDSTVSNNEEEAIVKTSMNDEASSSDMVSDGGPDVDKKADEFIAKFREQIRLQRIDSIKRSSEEISRSLAR